MKIKCMKCLKEYEVDIRRIPPLGITATCKACGNKICIFPKAENQNSLTIKANNTNYEDTPSLLTDSSKIDLAYFIGPNSTTYLSKFKKFHKNGAQSFSFSWHWPAFFFSSAWFFYRKLYLWAFIALFMAFLPVVNILMKIVWGATANYIYFKNANNRILKLQMKHNHSETENITHRLQKAGGVDKSVPYIGASIPVVGILLAVAIPNFTAYKTKHSIQKVTSAQVSYYKAHEKYADSIADLQENGNLSKDENIKIEILMANHRKYIIATNSKRDGRKLLLIGPQEIIKEIVSDNSNVAKAFTQKELKELRTNIYNIVRSLGYNINDVEPIGILHIADNYVVMCFKIFFDSFEGAFFFAPEANRYVIYNEPDDMLNFYNFLKMDIPEKIHYIKNDFKKLASFEFPIS